MHAFSTTLPPLTLCLPSWCQHPKLQSLVQVEGSLASFAPKLKHAYMLSLPESYEELIKDATAFK